MFVLHSQESIQRYQCGIACQLLAESFSAEMIMDCLREAFEIQSRVERDQSGDFREAADYDKWAYRINNAQWRDIK